LSQTTASCDNYKQKKFPHYETIRKPKREAIYQREKHVLCGIGRLGNWHRVHSPTLKPVCTMAGKPRVDSIVGFSAEKMTSWNAYAHRDVAIVSIKLADWATGGLPAMVHTGLSCPYYEQGI